MPNWETVSIKFNAGPETQRRIRYALSIPFEVYPLVSSRRTQLGTSDLTNLLAVMAAEAGLEEAMTVLPIQGYASCQIEPIDSPDTTIFNFDAWIHLVSGPQPGGNAKAIQQWGPKWNPAHAICIPESTPFYKLDVANSPPIHFARKLSGLIPGVEIALTVSATADGDPPMLARYKNGDEIFSQPFSEKDENNEFVENSTSIMETEEVLETEADDRHSLPLTEADRLCINDNGVFDVSHMLRSLQSNPEILHEPNARLCTGTHIAACASLYREVPVLPFDDDYSLALASGSPFPSVWTALLSKGMSPDNLIRSVVLSATQMSQETIRRLVEFFGAREVKNACRIIGNEFDSALRADTKLALGKYRASQLTDKAFVAFWTKIKPELRASMSDVLATRLPMIEPLNQQLRAIDCPMTQSMVMVSRIAEAIQPASRERHRPTCGL